VKTIIEGLAIEEAFELVLLDYIEYESSVFRLSLEGLIRGHSEQNSNFFDNRRMINRSISNFLSSSSAYTDQIEKMSLRYNGLKAKTLSHEYDTSSVYPFICKLRNYVQHYDVVIHEKRHGSFTLLEDLNSEGAPKPHNSSLELIIDKKRLMETDVFSKKVLKPIPDKIFITKTFRNYLGCLLRIHKATRDEMKYPELCKKIYKNEVDNKSVDMRKVDSLLGLIRKNYPVDIIQRTKMIGVK
jgi:hypothetical protein